MTLVNIAEPESHPKASEIRAMKEIRKQELASDPFGDMDIEIVDHELLEPYHRIVDDTRTKLGTSQNVWLDITTLPKRFFFPMMKMLLREGGPENLIVTYALAGSYADGNLHQDIQDPEFLPLFSPDVGHDPRTSGLVISIGFESSGVIQIIEQSDYSPITVLFPYPAPPPAFGRNWDFVRFAKRSIADGHLKMEGISFIDVPAIFELLRMKDSDPDAGSVFAPFGPKPVSLAMCLYAAGATSGQPAVMYSQPKFYSPVYSSGVREDSNGPIIYGYPIVIDGENRYAPAA